ncbi:MAG TPA: UDP-N-acetylglucosamine--N-acetylmuramyl-(pentapeptide) pyrophosphoryl-undecaprenol N-acetylglucosamine transferase [Anaerolineaceae bacterium]
MSVLQALGNDATSVLWVGSETGMERDLVKRSQVPYAAIPAAGVHGVGLRNLLPNLFTLARGITASRRILDTFQPDLCLYTGGYLAAPMAVATRIFRPKVPTLLFVPDIEPGMALKFLGRFASTITLTASESRKYFNPTKRMVVTGYPLRKELLHWTPELGKKTLGLSDQLPVLGIFGGSKGAQSINRVVLNNLSQILEWFQVVQITGGLDWSEVEHAQARLPRELAARYHPYAYLHDEIGAAFSACTLAVSRAGASTLGEFPHFGLPAILVPYPYAWRYQKVNASYLENRGAAMILPDELLATRLVPTLKELSVNPQKLVEMRKAMQQINTPNAAERIADQVRLLCGIAPRLEADHD